MFSGKVYHPEPPHAQSLFLFPIVFGINCSINEAGVDCELERTDKAIQEALAFCSSRARISPDGFFDTWRS